MPSSRAAAISAPSRSPAPRGCRYRWSVDGRAPAQRQLGEPDERAGVHRLLVDRTPQRVQRLQPAEQRLVGHRRVGAGEVLEHVVVGVDQPGRHQAVARVDDLGRRRRLVGARADGLDEAAGDGHPAAGELAALRRPSWPRAGRCADQQVGHAVLSRRQRERVDDQCDVVDRGARVDDAEAQHRLAVPRRSARRTPRRRPAARRSTAGTAPAVQPMRRNSSTLSSGSISSSRCVGGVDQPRAARGDRQRGLDRIAVGVGAVRREAEPERQPAGAAARGGGRSRSGSTPRRRLVVQHVEVLGVLRVRGAWRAPGRGTAARSSRTARTATCADRR